MSNTDREQLDQIAGWQAVSSNLRSVYDDQWTKNIRLLKGRFDDTESSVSKVRKRSKLFFRKIWATDIRILASMYNSLLRDRDNFKFTPEDTIGDSDKAKVLQKIVEYRRDQMYRDSDLLIKQLWTIQSIIDLGWGPAKLCWHYNPDMGIDMPLFVPYPTEQVYADWYGLSQGVNKMRYLIFENFLTKDECEEMGYENITDGEAESMPTHPVRSARFEGEQDPLQNPGENEYPSPGRYTDENRRNTEENKYRVWETFWIEDGVLMMATSNKNKVFFTKKDESPYRHYPFISGQCLLVPHKPFGEGFPEPLEGPQESLNATINQRKDNISLALNGYTVVSRWANADLKSLVNRRPGGLVLTDDPDGIREQKIPDVTQSSYMEAGQDERMMMEMSGVTDQKQGFGKETKATVAQINYAESNAKHDLFTAIIANTFLYQFYYKLGTLVQDFDSDSTLLKRINDELLKAGEIREPVGDLSMGMDIKLDIGVGAAGKEIQTQQTMLAIDRANQHNASMANMLQMGISPPGGIEMVNTSVFFKDLLKLNEKKDFRQYFFQAQPPQIPGGRQDSDAAGKNAPQVGGQSLKLIGGAQNG